MSEQAQAEDGRAAALVAFDAARDRFLAAFAQAPDEALPFVPAGEEYALGVLPMHMQDPMRHYLAVFEMVRAGDFGPLDLTGTAEADSVSPERHATIVAARPTGTDRPGMLAELAAAHERVRALVMSLDEATFARSAPVIYPPSRAPFATSCGALMGWLTDHYDEHTAQVGQLLEAWRRMA
jgi:hypothetical protein